MKKNQNKEPFNFEISLSVLNHLGRNLYRNFITILGEAISNSWDADANNVWIIIDKDKNSFVIKDDGNGMTHDCFKNKFLKIGYSKRKNGDLFSDKGRPFIGAKGIGKLALLSCSEDVTIISKTESSDYVGGVINNSDLDEAIKDDIEPDKYPLENFDIELFKDYTKDHDKGTIIKFNKIKHGIKNTISHLRGLLALNFRFSLLDPDFNIYVDNDLVTLDDLKDISEKTEFLWNINNLSDSFIEDHLNNLKESEIVKLESISVKGFIASVIKPSQLKISGTEEKAGVDLFVNGRLRERDIIKHLPDFATRHVASYIYGQIHFNSLDRDTNDNVFTSSREGVMDTNKEYKKLLDIFKKEVFNYISEKWDEWRIKHREDGDIENNRMSKYERRIWESKNWRAKDFKKKIDETVSDSTIKASLKNKLKELSEKNTVLYQDLFILENLLREYIKEKSIREEDFDVSNIDQKQVIDDIKNIRGNRREDEKTHVLEGKIVKEENYLNYTDLYSLSEIIDLKILNKGDKKKYHGKMVKDTHDIRPVRNPVMHTNEITDEALSWPKIKKLIDYIDRLK